MSQQDVDLFLTAADRLAAGDLEVFAELLHPDVTSSGVEDWPEPGPHHGVDRVLAELGRIVADFEEQRFADLETVAQLDDWTVIAYRWHVRGRGSQVETHFDLAVAYRLCDERLIELHFRRTPDTALAVAGIR